MSDLENKTLTLKTAITTNVGDEEKIINTLIFRKPKAKDLRARDTAKGDVDATIRLIAALSGQPVAVIDELASDDFKKAGEIVADFM